MNNYFSEEICPSCHSHLVFTESLETVHYGRLDCPQCRKWIRWISDPNKKKSNRNGTSDLTKNDILRFHNYNEEFCFICLRTKEMLGVHETMTIDHIKELDKGGKDEIENLQILCSACHKLKNWARLYLNWHFIKKCEGNDTNT